MKNLETITDSKHDELLSLLNPLVDFMIAFCGLAKLQIVRWPRALALQFSPNHCYQQFFFNHQIKTI